MGRLVVDSTSLQPGFVDDFLTIVFKEGLAQSEPIASPPVLLPAGQSMDINVRFPKGLIQSNLTVNLTWQDESAHEPSSTWQITFAPATQHLSGLAEVSLVAITPFSRATFHHTLYPGDYAGVVNFKVVAGAECRIAYYDEKTGQLCGVDATGDGKFDGVGDILGFDRDSDGYPDILVGQNLPHPISLRATPVNAVVGKSFELEVFRLSNGGWVSEATNVLLLESAP